jgi:hypothetical protein
MWAVDGIMARGAEDMPHPGINIGGVEGCMMYMCGS